MTTRYCIDAMSADMDILHRFFVDAESLRLATIYAADIVMPSGTKHVMIIEASYYVDSVEKGL